MSDCGHITHPEHWPGDAGDLLGIPSPTVGNHYEVAAFIATVMTGAALGLSTDTINAALHDLFEVEQ